MRLANVAGRGQGYACAVLDAEETASIRRLTQDISLEGAGARNLLDLGRCRDLVQRIRVHPLKLSRIAGYVWASPNTLFGIIAGLVVLACGGRVRAVQGTLEFSGGRLGSLVSSAPPFLSFSAITFGHVILGASAVALEVVREHEHVHVAQYEIWGPFLLPAYIGSSLWQLARGRRVYRDNFFERQAYARSKSDLPA